MNNFSFDTLARQSPKGIVINYFLILYKVFKSMWVLIPLIFTRRDYSFNLITILIGIGVIVLIVAILQYINFKFKIENEHFILHKGVFFKSKTSIPLERIQNVNFKQNIIHQIINVTQVEIQTAGSKGAEVSIKAISRERAEALKKKLQEVEFTGKETEDLEGATSRMLFKLSFLDLIKVSLSENHIKSFFGVFALVASLFYQMKDYLKDYDFLSIAANYYVLHKDEITGSLWVLSVLGVIVFVISVLVSFVRVILRHFDQKVSVINNGIQLSQGLFTKRTDVLKINKIQYTVAVSNPIKKRLGIQTIKVKQAGSAKVKQKKMIQLVGVKNEFVKALNTLFFKFQHQEGQEVIKPARYYLFKLSVKAIAAFIIINLLLFAFSTFQSKLIINALLIPYLILHVLLTYKKAYVSILDEKLVIGSGSVGTITTVMEYYKTQNVSVDQSFIQKRRGVATVFLQTASGHIKMKCLHEKDANSIVDTIIESASNSNRDWI